MKFKEYLDETTVGGDIDAPDIKIGDDSEIVCPITGEPKETCKCKDCIKNRKVFRVK